MVEGEDGGAFLMEHRRPPPPPRPPRPPPPPPVEGEGGGACLMEHRRPPPPSRCACHLPLAGEDFEIRPASTRKRGRPSRRSRDTSRTTAPGPARGSGHDPDRRARRAPPPRPATS